MSEQPDNVLFLAKRVEKLENEVVRLQNREVQMSKTLAAFGIATPPENNISAAPATQTPLPPNSATPVQPFYPIFQPNYYANPMQSPAQPLPAYQADPFQPNPNQVFAASAPAPNYNYYNPGYAPQPGYAPPYPMSAAPFAPARKSFDLARDGEWWLNKIGIGLLLLGLAFLFSYAIDQGWITPLLRVLIGMGIGCALLGFGLRTQPARPHFGRVLMGGGVAAFYISIFAAFQLYQLIPYWLAFGAMVGVTGLAFALSLWQDEMVLAMIGVIGGLATPFVLSQGQGSLTGLAFYTCVILVGAVSIYLSRGWLTLLWTTFVGTWLVFAIGLSQANGFGSTATAPDKTALQAAFSFGWLAFAALPMLREILVARDPARWPRPMRNFVIDPHRPPLDMTETWVNLMILLAPLLGLSFTASLWTMTQQNAGWLVLSAALLYAFATWGLSLQYQKLAYVHAAVGVLALTIAFTLLLQDNVLLLTLTAEALALLLVAARLNDSNVAVAAHLLFASLAYWVVVRLYDTGYPNQHTSFNWAELVNLIFIGAAFGASYLVMAKYKEVVLGYRLFAHLALLGWLWQELTLLPNSNGFVTLSWGIYALVLLVAGWLFKRDLPLKFGLATLLLVVAKLFLIDLVLVETGWRVLLFLGFGLLFLLLSYYFKDLWTTTPNKNKQVK